MFRQSLAAASLVVFAIASAPAAAQDSRELTSPQALTPMTAPSTAGLVQRSDGPSVRANTPTKPPLKEIEITDYTFVFPQLPDGIQDNPLPSAPDDHH